MKQKEQKYESVPESGDLLSLYGEWEISVILFHDAQLQGWYGLLFNDELELPNGLYSPLLVHLKSILMV